MTDMLEKIARAIADAMASDDNHPHDIARAALLAMRGPDEAMIDAAINREEDIVGTYGCADPTGEFTPDGPSICFTAMIDAILAQPSIPTDVTPA